LVLPKFNFSLIHQNFKELLMKISFLLFCFLMSNLVRSQSATDRSHTDKVIPELQKLWNDMQDAAVNKDRKALESFYADEFIFIHSSGQEDNKLQRINSILSVTDYVRAPMPSFDELYVYGDVAVLRAKGAGRGTTIFVKKMGQWQIAQVQSTAMPPGRKTVTLDPKILRQYVGKYEQAPGVFTMITFENDTLRAKGATRPQIPILPLSDTLFYVKDNVGEFTFYKNDKNEVTHYVLRVNGREIRGTKVE
jgi:Domain of unknown function (DUF4440)/Domain of unknown function (DUF3471)